MDNNFTPKQTINIKTTKNAATYGSSMNIFENTMRRSTMRNGEGSTMKRENNFMPLSLNK